MKSKKVVLMGLTAALLLSASTACTRRDHYEDILESQNEAESQANLPQAGANGKHNIIGTVIEAADWNVTIAGEGDKGYFEGKSKEELYRLFKQNGNEFEHAILPTGRAIQASNGSAWFYNKMTGNILPWCPDALCQGEEECLFSGMWVSGFEQISYVGENHLYFTSEYNDFIRRLYRCDHQRNNVEMIYTLPTYDGMSGYIQIVCEVGNSLYFLESDYAGSGSASITALKRLDMDTGEVEKISGKDSIWSCYYIRGEFYYQLNYGEEIFKNNLSFDQQEVFWEGMSIDDFNHKYILFAPNHDENGDLLGESMTILNMETGETFSQPYGECYLSGDYLYYRKALTDEEIENSPHKEYYLWTNDSRLNGRAGSGSIYRKVIGSDEEELVFAATYQDKPVRISIQQVDGDCIWMWIHTYVQWQNYYNQDKNWRDNAPMLVNYLAVADLGNGTLRFISVDDAGENIHQYT